VGSKRSTDLSCRSAAFRARQRSWARFTIASARHRAYIDRMSRLRRPFLYDRYIFVTVDLLRSRGKLEERDFGRLAIALTRMWQRHRFRLTARVFLPDHWHAIIYPPHPVSIAQAMSAVKVSSMITINHGRQEKGELWQERFFDHALRTVKDYWETVEYIPLNPVRRSLVKRPE